MISLKIVVIADLHIGSFYGYLCSGAMNKKGVLINQSKDQKLMEKNLLDQLTKIGHIDILIIVGDICEGKQVKMMGRDLHDADTDTTVKWATNTIEDIVSILKPKHIIIVKGTDYHVTNAIGGDLDYQVADKLAANHDVYYGNPIANAKIGKLLWRITHKYPTTRNITSPMETFYKEYCTSAKIHGYEVPDVFVWAHSHQCVEPHRIKSTSAYVMMSPAQKLNDPYIATAFYAMEPDIGFIYIEQNDKQLNGRFIRTFN